MFIIGSRFCYICAALNAYYEFLNTVEGVWIPETPPGCRWKFRIAGFWGPGNEKLKKIMYTFDLSF